MSNNWCHTCVAPTQPIPNGDELECSACHGCFVEQIEENDNPQEFVPLVSMGEQKEPSQQSAEPNFGPSVSYLPFPTQNPPAQNMPPPLGPFQGNARVIHISPNGVQVEIVPGNQNDLPLPLQQILAQFQMSNAAGPANPFNFLNQMFGAFAGPHFGDYAGDNIQHIINHLFLSDPNRHGAPPASQKVIQELADIKVDDDLLNEMTKAGRLTECSVCKDPLQTGDIAKKLPCNHYYHVDCIMPWLRMHNSCPTCRYQLPTDDPHYERYRHEREAQIRQRLQQQQQQQQPQVQQRQQQQQQQVQQQYPQMPQQQFSANPPSNFSAASASVPAPSSVLSSSMSSPSLPLVSDSIPSISSSFSSSTGPSLAVGPSVSYLPSYDFQSASASSASSSYSASSSAAAVAADPPQSSSNSGVRGLFGRLSNALRGGAGWVGSSSNTNLHDNNHRVSTSSSAVARASTSSSNPNGGAGPRSDSNSNSANGGSGGSWCS